MASRPRAKAKRAPELSEGPNEARRQHASFTRDVLSPEGAPVVARHRVRTVLTPLAVRRAILEEAAGKPEAVRVRSLRRRLTALDRVLSDGEAEAIERLTSCIHDLSNSGCAGYLRTEIRSPSYGRLPFTEGRRLEIAAMSHVLRGLTPLHKSIIFELVILLDPSQSQRCSNLTPDFIELARAAACEAAAQYGDWQRKEALRAKDRRAGREAAQRPPERLEGGIQ